MQTQYLTDVIAVQQERDGYASIDRDAAIKAIRQALKRRSGKSWSVTGGRGTGWGWLRIDAPPKRRTARWFETGEKARDGHPAYELRDTGRAGGYMTPTDAAELCALLGLERVHHQGVSIPASNGHWIEYIARAEGRNPSTYGVRYWD